MERQGSGFKKIMEAYRAAHNYRAELAPKFYSDSASFQVTLYNLNYGIAVKVAIEDENLAIAPNHVAIEDENLAIAPDHVAIEVAIGKLNVNQATIEKIRAVYESIGIDGVFGRSDIATITNDSVTAAGNLIAKLKKAGLIEAVRGYGKGEYQFVKPLN